FHDFEFSRARPDATEGHFLTSGEPRFGPDGAFLGYRGVGRNVTDLVQARERIAQLAYTDLLTGLANRTSLGPALEHAVQLARRHEKKLAIMFLDLDGFKQINDQHGHDAGDRLLTEVADRLRVCLRTSDLVARLGGDEFIVLLEQVQDTNYVQGVARRLLAEIARPYSLVAGEESRVSASIGISMLPDDAGDPRTLMKHADTAMYCAKQSGKNGYRFFAGESGDSTTQTPGPDHRGAGR
ncbi:MAG: GGDEF domain-containing protein, partial [Sulfuricaulis sp.]|nr:GGDEF domain-containing protein [Sulfuricaulis sp.]